VSLLQALYIAACAIAALLSAGNLAREKKSPVNYILAALLASVAASLALAALRAGDFAGAKRPLAPFLSLLAICGIMVRRLFLALARLDTERRRNHRLLFLLMIPSGLSDILVHGFHLGAGSPSFWAFTLLGLHMTVGALVLALCLGSIGQVFALYSSRTMTKPAWTVFIVSIAGAVALVIGFAGMALGRPELFDAMDGFIALVVIVVALLSYRYPDALDRFHEDTVQRRYAHSLLAGLEIEGLAAGMIEMVRRTALYRDEECSLGKLSARMGLSAHQVSELLNDWMGTNFSTFINGFRVEAAKELLLSRPETTMLAIAMEVGFGNKTSFNEAFKRAVRMTPSEFRGSGGKTRQDR
jgi:AraC-like DNA-binding protein